MLRLNAPAQCSGSMLRLNAPAQCSGSMLRLNDPAQCSGSMLRLNAPAHTTDSVPLKIGILIEILLLICHAISAHDAQAWHFEGLIH